MRGRKDLWRSNLNLKLIDLGSGKDDIRKASATELTKVVCKKKGISINAIAADTWRMCSKGELSLISSPTKAMFYTIKKELDEDTIEQIVVDQKAKREKRMDAFMEIADAIENGESAESLVRSGLNIT